MIPASSIPAAFMLVLSGIAFGGIAYSALKCIGKVLDATEVKELHKPR